MASAKKPAKKMKDLKGAKGKKVSAKDAAAVRGGALLRSATRPDKW